MTQTQVQTKGDAVISLVKAIGNAIKEAGAVPAGTLYAILSAHGCTKYQFDELIAAFKEAGKIREVANLLYWIEK